MVRPILAAAVVLLASTALAAPLSDVPERLGAQESVGSLSLSPDGTKLSHIVPAKGPASALMIVGS